MKIPFVEHQMGRIRHLHFVGIGGAGMGGIAEILLNEGYRISGSDLQENTITRHLQKLGATIKHGHHEKYIRDADVIVYSSAVSCDNVEIQAARHALIPVVPRALMLAEIMRFRYSIAVAGTHGKTTTTSLVASLLGEGGLDPTFVIGGKLNSTRTHARLGSGRYLVAEADESDASFLYLKPMIAIVTNIDRDHMGTYSGNFQQLKKSFLEFLWHLPFYGLAVLCCDDPFIRSILPDIMRPILTYGFSEDADIRITSFQQKEIKNYFRVLRPKKKPMDIILNLPGEHNALNALAAIAVASELGIKNDVICKALSHFSGVDRRFQVLGKLTCKHGDALLIDDYGHHPREIAATLKAIRHAWPDRRLVMTYQPHRYTRTRDLFSDFVKILSQVDHLLLLNVYAAGEAVISGADSAALLKSIHLNKQINPIHIEDKEKLMSILDEIIQDGDVLLLQGAGDIGSIAQKLALSVQRE
ncbi:UDP-N-acetylmuramate--L-alanine ligase [Rickettsiella grylli]|uniref:UDP-N-acetylmuramate--L-alanine ligase n=1 Tax=Rickettsiella grylli TaxID=59196 RepID=A8PL57_9COXI|nr:UDP-N-acetylmuramate--L-alanine ligase [Rickettsiella grylli]EDP45765.1 UDP-N-acetylmuramate--alanine ligase [Rickettsiella grylli]